MKNNTPKVSIVTTTLNLFKDNRQEFFRKCIESVHNQTYPNIEHIIIDGASTDDTLELIKEYQKKVGLHTILKEIKALMMHITKD